MSLLRDSDNHSLNYDASTRSRNRLKVFGKGSVSVRPDAAEVIIGVITEDQELQTAQQENARITTEVINSIKATGVAPKYIQTQNYNIRANYDYINGRQVFRGYEVSNNIEVLIRDISAVGEIIDTAVRNGANSLSGIIFIITDETTHYLDALRLAVKDAQNKASIIASELKVKLNITPIQINEQNEESVAPLVMSLKNTSSATPIEAGENIINADIEAVFVYDEY